MNKFWWSVLMIAAICILGVIDIKTMNTWVVVANVVLGVVAAFAAYKLGKFPASKKQGRVHSFTGREIRTTLSYIVALVCHVIQSAILEHGRFNATKTVLWCNGNTSDFGSEIPSSNLGRITIVLIKA